MKKGSTEWSCDTFRCKLHLLDGKTLNIVLAFIQIKILTKLNNVWEITNNMFYEIWVCCMFITNAQLLHRNENVKKKAFSWINRSKILPWTYSKVNVFCQKKPWQCKQTSVSGTNSASSRKNLQNSIEKFLENVLFTNAIKRMSVNIRFSKIFRETEFCVPRNAVAFMEVGSIYLCFCLKSSNYFVTIGKSM